MAVAHILAVHFHASATPERRQAFIDALDEAPERVAAARRWVSGPLGRYYPIATTDYEHGLIVEADDPQAVADIQAAFDAGAGRGLWEEVVANSVAIDFSFSVAQESAVAHQRPATGDPGEFSIAHCSILAFKEGATPEAIEEATRRLKRAAREEPSIRRSILGPVQALHGTSAAYALAFIDEVDSADAMDVYIKHPYHREQLSPALGPIIQAALVIDIAYRRVLARV